jgi:ATP-dependent Clp protease, protease subunit
MLYHANEIRPPAEQQRDSGTTKSLAIEKAIIFVIILSMKKYIAIDPRIRAKENIVPIPIVARVNKFDEEGAKLLAADVSAAHESGQTVLPVLIDSYGGQVYSLLEMISLLQSSRLPVITVCEGKAMSCGACLFGFGKERYMSEHATLMIHPVSNWSHGKVEDIKADAKETERLNKLIFTMLSKQLGHRDDYFLKLIDEKKQAEWYLTSKDAKKHNLCTHVGVPELKVEVKVEYRFSL